MSDDSLVGFLLDQSRRDKVANLASLVQSGQMAPNDAMMTYAQQTGDPEALQQGIALKKLAALNMNDPRQAIQQAVQGGMLPLQQGIDLSLNPMVYSGSQAASAPPTNGSQPATSPSPLAQLGAAATSQPKPSALASLDTNYLNNYVPPFYRNQVLDVIQGGELAKDVSPRDRTLIMNWAHNVDPTFTETKGTLRSKMANDIASNSAGSQGGQAVQLNSVAGHLYDLHEASKVLPSADAPLLNSGAHLLLNTFGGDGLGRLSTYSTILNRASPELNKFYVGGEGDAEGRKSAKDDFAANLPPPTIQNNVKTQVGLLMSKANALQQKRDGIMGAATTSVLDPTAQALMDDINGAPLTPQQQQLVNAHRQESNLPPKTWQQPAGTATPPTQQPQITPEMAKAELARRAAAKKGGK